MQIPTNKFNHHKIESITHSGFLETLDRCATGGDAVEFDSPKFVECVKASAINYANLTQGWLNLKRLQGRRASGH